MKFWGCWLNLTNMCALSLLQFVVTLGISGWSLFPLHDLHMRSLNVTQAFELRWAVRVQPQNPTHPTVNSLGFLPWEQIRTSHHWKTWKTRPMFLQIYINVGKQRLYQPMFVIVLTDLSLKELPWQMRTVKMPPELLHGLSRTTVETLQFQQFHGTVSE